MVIIAFLIIPVFRRYIGVLWYVVVKFQKWRWKLVEIAREYTVS
jgi:hypothetical protein